MNPNSLKNLISFDMMSEERHRELSARGGVAAGESKRRKIKLREGLIQIMEYNAARSELEDEVVRAVRDIRKRELKRERDRQRKQRERSAKEPRNENRPISGN